MSKNSLDLQYMKESVKVKTGVKAGAARPIPLYGIIGIFPAYGIIYPLYGIEPVDIEVA